MTNCSAKDDAAGLAISTRMERNIRGMTVAIRNANDGLSILQTAEGAIDEMTNALQRIYELAVQAASYNTNLDRSSMNQEVQQLIDELSRTVNQTRYNGEKLFTGLFSADIQVGVEVNETINISISNLSPSSMGVASNYYNIANLDDATLANRIATQYLTATSGTPTVNDVQISSSAISSGTNAVEKVNLLNQYSSSTGVTAFVYGNGLIGLDYSGGAAADIAAGALVVNGISIDAVSAGLDVSATADNLVDAINAKTAQHGVIAVNDTTNSRIVLINRNGAAITVTANSTVDSDITTFFSDGTTSVDAGANGAIVLNQSLGNNTVTFDASTTAGAFTGDTTDTTENLSDASVNAMVVTSAAEANLTMLAVKEAMETINAERAVIGAKLNRFESVIRNLENIRENMSAAKSRIMDADYAVETANLTRALILQQAGISVLAQANTIPQNVLALLGGR